MTDSLTSSALNLAIVAGREHLKHAGLGWCLPTYSIIDRLVLAAGFAGRNDEPVVAGADSMRFTLMSVVKPFLLLRQLQLLGADGVARLVDNEPSEMSFFSLEQLEADNGRPRNAMLNSGALLLTDKLPPNEPAAHADDFVQWLNDLAGCQLSLCEDTFHEMMSTLDESSVNWALAHYLAESGHCSDPLRMLDAYFRLCCLAGDIRDAVKLARVLAFPHPAIEPSHREQVLSAMRVCGLYEESREWANQWGVPTKSGVSGILIASVPNMGGIATFSPWLKPGGNSGGAMLMMGKLLQALPGSDAIDSPQVSGVSRVS